MKLTPGAYEHLITKALQGDMRRAEETDLVCLKDKIDAAEAPAMVAEYVARLVRKRLAADDLTAEEKRDLANALIGLIDGIDGEKIADDKEMLTEVVGRAAAKAHSLTKTLPVRPLSGFRVSNLFTGGQSAVPLGAEIIRDIASADRISLIVSFLKLAGVNLIYDALKAFCNRPGHKLRIITTTYCGITEAKAVERLSALPNTELRISYNTKIERLHAKAYIFERQSGMSTAYIGSSNLSKSAQTDGLEWNIRVTNVENPHIIRTALATFDIYWNSPNFEDFSDGGIDKFYAQARKERARKSGVIFLDRFTILPHQKQLLDRLATEREQGLTRNLIVAATGTGKTVVSAFDYCEFRRTHTDRRILFVAHRKEILEQALHTYRCVLHDANFGSLWVGGLRPAHIGDDLFVSVQTFNAHFDDYFSLLPTDHYAYIVIDEAHHIAADGYRPIITHFDRPALLIGLTATPERMDGRSLLPDFGGRISAEIRLPRALNEGLLTPFQYYCISDSITDLSNDELMTGNRYIPARLAERLSTTERAALIVDRLHYYLPDERACRALCFCATTAHAAYMARALREAGLRAESLTSDNADERHRLSRALADGRINYLCVVDMFNEGIDIPKVDTVLFLRPTDSLTIFLQQLGRGLRLAPGKQLLTVLDFVSRLNRRYDYAGRFRSLLLRTDRSLADQVKNGFTLLPHGCAIHMEEKAQSYVLENIRAAIYNKARLVRELAGYAIAPTITAFLATNGLDVRLLYKGRHCWTWLKREAKLCTYADDGITRRLERGIGTLCHVNTPAYLRFIATTTERAGRLNADALTPEERTYALMLYYALFQDTITKLHFASIYDALARLTHYPLFLTEIHELATHLLQSLESSTQPLGDDLPATLRLYGSYTREEVFIIMGRQTPTRRMQGQVAGVFAFNERNTEVFFVTLNKSDKDFSPTTQYDDYVMGERLFHWQSQNTDAHDGSGRRFVEQRLTGRRFLLFVRDFKTDGYGNTCPFRCFGFANYLRSYGDRPMNIEWQLRRPVPAEYLKSV